MGDKKKSIKPTYRTNSLRHLGHAHKDCQTPSTEGCNGELVFNIAELCGGVQDPDVVKFGQKLGFHPCPEGIL
jgi:hypothetical protein